MNRWVRALFSRVGTSASRADFGELGVSLTPARRNGLFTWFHLEPVEGESVPAGSIRFRPSGEQFHRLVALDVSVEGDTIKALHLTIARSFIEGRNSPFARDIVKSFLRAALPESLLEKIVDLLNEIESNSGPATVIRRADVSRPETPAVATRAYRVFLGEHSSFRATQGGMAVELQNDDENLLVAVKPM